MPSKLKPSLLMLIALSIVVVVMTVRESLGSPRASSQDDQDDRDATAMLGLFPLAKDCGPLEEPKPGHLPEYEPTCQNPSRVQPRIFITLDHVPCFCKAPRVRDTRSGRCIKLADCPK